jgi:hypothetical protein
MGRQPLHWYRPQGASKRFVGQGSGVSHHPRGHSLFIVTPYILAFLL